MKVNKTTIEINGTTYEYWFDVRSYGRGLFYSWLQAKRLSDGARFKGIDPEAKSRWARSQVIPLLSIDSLWEVETTKD